MEAYRRSIWRFFHESRIKRTPNYMLEKVVNGFSIRVANIRVGMFARVASVIRQRARLLKTRLTD